MARLPIPGGDNDNWGTLLNDYLQQSIAADGTLLTTPTNAYTSAANTNLANATRPGLVQLAGDLTVPLTAPKVAGLQGNPVATTTPTDGQVLTWVASATQWSPTTPAAGPAGVSRTITSTSSPLTAGSTANVDYVYLVSGTTTITLPTAVSNANKYTITNVGTTTVTVATTGGQTIVGSATATIPLQNMSLDLLSNGSNWVIQ